MGFGRIWVKVQLYATVILDSHYNYIKIFNFGCDFEPLFLPDNMYQSQHQAHQMKGKDLQITANTFLSEKIWIFNKIFVTEKWLFFEWKFLPFEVITPEVNYQRWIRMSVCCKSVFISGL